MNSDRELLEMAAKAAGIEVAWHSSNQPVRLEAGGPFGKVAMGFWNPLLDDGAALRLAVKLHLEITIEPEEIWAGHYTKEFPDGLAAGSDPYATTRRAIVRAAAEIGKAMP